MRGLLCGTAAKTNEEYREVVKRRMRINLLMALAGFLTVAAAAAFKQLVKGLNDYMDGIYVGIGSGLLFASIVLWLKNRAILKDEGKLKESRLINSDERLKEISNKAFRTASFILIIVLYAVALVGGVFYPVLVEILSLLVSVFVLAYIIAYRYYNTRM